MRSERKSIFITGAASGIGRATARLFSRNGWFVGICDLDTQGLETLVSEIGPKGCHAAMLDVSDRAAYQGVLKNFGDKTGGTLDLLFNNAGISGGGLFGDMDFADIEKIIQVNLMGVVIGIHSAYSMLKETPNSLCFTTSSSSGILGVPGIATYSATKHAVKGLTEALSVEFSLFDIRAADTLPGHIDTAIWTDEAKNDIPEEGMWRLITAESVADVVWASYHDKSGRLHWYVPDDLTDYEKWIAEDIETARNGSREHFLAKIKRMFPNNND